MIYFVRLSADSSLENVIIRRSGGDKPRRYAFGALARIISCRVGVEVSSQKFLN